MNKYDEIKLDTRELIKRQDALSDNYNLHSSSRGNWLFNLVKLYLQGFLMKTGIHQRLIYSNLSLAWFYHFKNYWIGELGARPINPHDFYFLMSHYRQKYQNLALKKDASPKEFLETWQDSRNIYSLFSNVFKNALLPLSVYKFARYIQKGATVCEYGCGIAPIAQGLTKYYSHKNLRIHCADIPNILFHYTRWNLRDYDFVKFIKINPADNNTLEDNYDAIFVLTVFEHLPNPLAVVKHLYKKLNPKALLIFDYIRSEGEGLDTKEGLKLRLEVLKFIKDNFQIIKGEIYLDNRDIGATIAKKI